MSYCTELLHPNLPVCELLCINVNKKYESTNQSLIFHLYVVLAVRWRMLVCFSCIPYIEYSIVLYSLYFVVHTILYCILYTIYSIYCIVCTVFFTLHCIKYTVCILKDASGWCLIKTTTAVISNISLYQVACTVDGWFKLSSLLGTMYLHVCILLVIYTSLTLSVIGWLLKAVRYVLLAVFYLTAHSRFPNALGFSFCL
jgi:hypothetical protein